MNRRSKNTLDLLGTRVLRALSKSYEKKTALEAEAAGARLGLCFQIDTKHRRRALENLRLAFPSWSDSQRCAVRKEMYRHFGRVVGDFLRSPARTDEEVLASIQVEGEEHLMRASEMGRGILMITGHFGNWERLSQWLVAKGYRPIAIARDANQAGIQQAVLKIRESVGLKVMSRGDSARPTLVHLRRNGTVAMLADQNSDECFVPFFGHPCGTVKGPAVLHQRTGAALLNGYAARIGADCYRLMIYPIIDEKNEQADSVQLVADLNACLEQTVREYPEQWLWMHDRWKSARQRGLLAT